MAKKFFPRALSVGLSLALCAGMVAPAFAASFSELNEAISSETDGTFGANEDIYASTGEDGVRNVELLGNVTYAGEDDATTINVSTDVTIDLKGNNIDAGYEKGQSEGSKDSVITVTGGADLTIKDSTAQWTTTTDAEGNEVKIYESGKITGGNATGVAHENNVGGGVYVADGDLTLEGGTITENNSKENGGGVYVGKNSSFTMSDGAIANNTTGNSGGGVYLNTELSARPIQGESTFVMEGGEISGNTAGSTEKHTGSGGGIGAVTYAENQEYTQGYDTIVINGGTIKDNIAGGQGGGIDSTNGTIKINGSRDAKVEISGNKAGNYGGGIYSSGSNTEISNAVISKNETTATNAQNTVGRGGGIYAGGGTMEIKDSEISGNNAIWGGGIYEKNSSVNLGEGTVIANNTAKYYGDDVSAYRGTITLSDIGSMNATLKKDGKAITGWYMDRTGDTYAWYYTEQKAGTIDLSKGTNANYTWGWKAAHNEYFGVSYYLDEEASEPYASFAADDGVEKGFIPAESVAPGENPTRDGFNFLGWVATEGIDADGKVTGEVKFIAQWEAAPVVPTPETPDLPDDTDETEIDDQAIPLAAGPVTRAEFIDYLWRHEGEPASDGVCTFTDVPEDHQFVLALAWAEQNGIAEAYLGAEGHEDGTFEPDELVTVGDVREFLGSFAGVFGTNAVVVDELTTLASDDGEAVLNCDQVLAEFFGEEYTPANTKNDELDIAA